MCNFLSKKCPIWSFSGPHFTSFGLHMDTYRINLCIQQECGKIQTRKTPNNNHYDHQTRTIEENDIY